MNFSKKIIPVIILLLLSEVSETNAQKTSPLGGSAGVPLRAGFAARGIGMGNALSAVSSGEINGYYNPALVPFQTMRTAQVAFGILSLDRRLNFAGYGQQLKPTAGIFFGIINAGVSNIDGRDVDGQPTQTYSTSENSFFLSFGTRVSEQLSFGITSKILYYHLYEGLNSTTVGFDVGVLYAINDQWTASAVIQDINAKYKWDTANLYGQTGNTTVDNFPLRRKLGICFRPDYYDATVSAEAEFVGPTFLVRLGAEISPLKQFTVRAGLDQIDVDGNLIAKPSVGFTLMPEFGFVSSYIHYAYVFEPYSPGNMHIISLSVTFD
jgi:hypothetical protein